MDEEFEDTGMDTGSDMSDGEEMTDDSSMDAGDEPIEDSGSEGLDDSGDGELDDGGEGLDDSSMDAGDEPVEDSGSEGLEDDAGTEDLPDGDGEEFADEQADDLPEEEEPVTDGEDAPVEDEEVPTEDEDAPVEDEEVPPEDEDAPVEDEEVPPEDEEVPPEGEDQPTEGTEEPTDENAEAPDDGANELPENDTENPTDQPADQAAEPEDDGTDWDRTSLTPEQEQQLREMDEAGEIDIPKENPNWQEPVQKDAHLPTEKTGTFDGERGNSAFRPNDEAAQSKMSEYGRDAVDYKDGNPDFSPFTQHDTPYGEMDGQVEIPHMTDNRENPAWEFGRRPAGTGHDPNYDLGNFAQADNALSEKMGNMTPEQVQDYRKANNLTWHECPDGKTMQLVPTEIHDACRHSGGVSEQKYRMAMGDITAPSY